jgi:hypothetical protein
LSLAEEIALRDLFAWEEIESGVEPRHRDASLQINLIITDSLDEVVQLKIHHP